MANRGARVGHVSDKEPRAPLGFGFNGCAWYHCPINSVRSYFVTSRDRADNMADGSPIVNGVVRRYCATHAKYVLRDGYGVMDTEVY